MLSETHLDPIFPKYPPPITQNFFEKKYHGRTRIENLGCCQCCGSGMFIPDPGSRVKNIPDPRSESTSKNVFLTQKIVS
jgi:hypothetical protein